MKKIIFRLALAFILIALSLWPGLSYAIVGPGGAASIISVDAYQNSLDTGDMVIIVEYQLIYPPTAYPVEPIDQAYIGRLYSSTGVVIANIQPYADAYFVGYNKGVFAFYFDPADAPTWNQDYIVRLQGNPTLNWTTAIPNYSMNLTAGSSQFHTTDNPDTTKNWIASRIRNIARDIESSWQIDLISGAPLRFTTEGTTYFSGAIPNLSLMAPGVFPNIIVSPGLIVKTFNTSYSDTLVNQWQNVPLMQNIMYETLFGLSPTMWKAMFWLVFMAFIAYGVAQATPNNTKPVWFITFPQMFIGVLFGFIVIDLVGVIGSLAYIGLGYVIFWRD